MPGTTASYGIALAQKNCVQHFRKPWHHRSASLVSIVRCRSGRDGVQRTAARSTRARGRAFRLTRPRSYFSQGLNRRLHCAMLEGGQQMADRKNACCSSPAAVVYWLCVTMCSWAVLSLIGTIWHPLHATSAIAILFAMSAGCFANWIRNRTYHCSIDGPLFLVAGALFLLQAIGIVHFPPLIVWLPLLIGIAVSFCLEWRMTRQRR